MEAMAFLIVTIVAVFVFIGLFIVEDNKQKKQTKSGGSYEDLFKKPERYLFSFSAISVTFSVIVEQE